MRNKNGFTLVEILITVTIISIMSVVVSSLIITNRDLTESTADKFFAESLCENSVVLFRSSAAKSSDLDELEENFYTLAMTTFSFEYPIQFQSENNAMNATIFFNEDFRDVQSESENIKYTCTYKFTIDENKIIFDVAVRGDDEISHISYVGSFKEKI